MPHDILAKTRLSQDLHIEMEHLKKSMRRNKTKEINLHDRLTALENENAQLKYDKACMQMDIDGYRGEFVPATYALFSSVKLLQNYYSMFNLLFDYIFDAKDDDKSVGIWEVDEARFAFDAIRGRQFDQPEGLDIWEKCEYYFGDKMIDKDTSKTFEKPLDYCAATHEKFMQPENKAKRDKMVKDSGLLEKLGLNEEKIRKIRAIINE